MRARCGKVSREEAQLGGGFRDGLLGVRGASPPGARFCTSCGAAAVAAPVTTHPAPERTPRAYTPKHLADKILASRAALEGERKQVTVLFADVRGSMELAERVDAEHWHAILDRFFAILTDGEVGVYQISSTPRETARVRGLAGKSLAFGNRICICRLHNIAAH